MSDNPENTENLQNALNQIDKKVDYLRKLRALYDGEECCNEVIQNFREENKSKILYKLNEKNQAKILEEKYNDILDTLEKGT